MAYNYDNLTRKDWNNICTMMESRNKKIAELEAKVNEQAQMVYQSGEDARKAQKHFDEMIMTQKNNYEQQLADINKRLSDTTTRLVHTEGIAQNFISRHAEADGLPVRSITDIVNNEIMMQEAINEAYNGGEDL